MAFIARAVIILIGFIAALLASSLFVNLLLLGGLRQIEVNDPIFQGLLVHGFIVTVPMLAFVLGYFSLLPSALVIFYGEYSRKTDWLYYAIGGGLAALAALIGSGFALTQGSVDIGMAAATAAAGAVGGMAYWIIAGRSSRFIDRQAANP